MSIAIARKIRQNQPKPQKHIDPKEYDLNWWLDLRRTNQEDIQQAARLIADSFEAIGHSANAFRLTINETLQ